MKPFLYTNPTSSDWNPNLYSKQIGGDQCNVVCKKKCKKNCTTYCQLAKEDIVEFKEAINKLKEKRDKLKEKFKVMEEKEKDHEQKRIRELVQGYNLTQTDKDILLRKLKKEGGTKKTKKIKKIKKNKKTKGGFNWFSNYGLEPCEKSCTDKCEPQCKSVCTDASFLVHDNKEVVSLQNEIKLLEFSIDRIESKLNL